MTDTATLPLYPVSLLLAGEKCLLVGGGRIAARKLGGLVECGATVNVVAPETVAEVDALAAHVEHRRYRRGDVVGFRLVIAATGNPRVDTEVFADGEANGVLVNAADLRTACRFYVPAVLRRGPVSVAISTAGASPYLASWLRRRLADTVGKEYEEIANILSEVRESLRSAGIGTEGLPWGELLDDDLVAEVAAGDLDRARARAAGWLVARQADMTPPGGPR